jgi:hypothetical protein
MNIETIEQTHLTGTVRVTGTLPGSPSLPPQTVTFTVNAKDAPHADDVLQVQIEWPDR